MIDSYSFGHIVVDGKPYSADVIIYPERVEASWWRKEGHNLCLDDIRAVLDTQPEVLVIGMGKPGLMKVPQSLQEDIRRRGVDLFVESTSAAVKKYNQIAPTKRTVAALHLTC